MLLVITSDMHIGDPSSRLVKNKVFNSSGTYSVFKEEIFKRTGGSAADYLILNGDILDFSISDFHNTIEIARPFFQQLKTDNITKEIVYIPGNHDKQIWDAVQWDTSIIGNLSEFYNPVSFQQIQAGILDLPKKTKINLPGIEPDSEGKYGNMFLKGMFKSKEEIIPISVVYPNLYVKTNKDMILITHGHMIEQAWVMLSELFRGIEGIPNIIDLKALEEWNVPLTSMICTGVGQGGEVSKLFYRIEEEAYKNNIQTLKNVLDKIIPRIDELIKLPWLLEGLDNIALNALSKVVLSIALKAEDSRNNKDYFKDDDAKKRFITFLNATIAEMTKLNLGRPNKILYGHTHIPTPANQPFNLNPAIPNLDFYNTGGWLPTKESEKNAELFFIDENNIASVLI